MAAAILTLICIQFVLSHILSRATYPKVVYIVQQKIPILQIIFLSTDLIFFYPVMGGYRNPILSHFYHFASLKLTNLAENIS